MSRTQPQTEPKHTQPPQQDKLFGPQCLHFFPIQYLNFLIKTRLKLRSSVGFVRRIVLTRLSSHFKTRPDQLFAAIVLRSTFLRPCF